MSGPLGGLDRAQKGAGEKAPFPSDKHTTHRGEAERGGARWSVGRGRSRSA